MLQAQISNNSIILTEPTVFSVHQGRWPRAHLEDKQASTRNEGQNNAAWLPEVLCAPPSVNVSALPTCPLSQHMETGHPAGPQHFLSHFCTWYKCDVLASNPCSQGNEQLISRTQISSLGVRMYARMQGGAGMGARGSPVTITDSGLPLPLVTVSCLVSPLQPRSFTCPVVSRSLSSKPENWHSYQTAGNASGLGAAP